MEEYLEHLNENQREAVLYVDGPELVIAGAGSGKTRVLTYKIAYLLDRGLPPYTILALTFTNKAAREMKERVSQLTEPSKARQLWMGTFHSIFSRILRIEAECLGYPRDFTIYDADDSKSLIRSIIKEMKLDDKTYRPGLVQRRISSAKNALVTPSLYAKDKEVSENDRQARLPLIAEIYREYQSRCRQAGAMDFDDLLMQTNILFRDHPAVLDKYRSRFHYILVDEYQDTNFAQHLIIQRLTEGCGRVCLVGDDAQSIYSFRGANIDNILKLKETYPNLRVFKLERNYRSTRMIVGAANSLIHKNRDQIQKNVFSEKEAGNKIRLLSSFTDYEEAYVVASQISGMRMGKTHYAFADFAVLYRTNSQSRILEEALRKRNIPYRIYGGLSFYQRKEIKDILSYLRLIINPHDEEALKRVINYPARGIGDTTVGKLTSAAAEHGVSAWTVLKDPDAYALPINSGTRRKLDAFREMIEEFIDANRSLPAQEMVMHVVRQTEILSTLYQDRSVEGVSRQENVQELLKGISEYIQLRLEEGDEETTLADFLSEVALITDQDSNSDADTDKVTLMTVHAAKGLEFRNVFVVGLEENLFPSQMANNNPRAIEEERRLFYVAITRAEENCVLTYAKNRFRNGKSNTCSPSRFLEDIDPQFLHATGEEASSPEPQPRVREPKPAPFPSPFRQPRAVEKQKPSSMEYPHLEPMPMTPEEIARLQPGVKIIHNRFGKGEIISMEGEGASRKAIIEFVNMGQKAIILKYAKLVIVEN